MYHISNIGPSGCYLKIVCLFTNECGSISNCFHLKKCLVDFHPLHALINHIPKLQVQEVHIFTQMLMYAQCFNCLLTILFIFVPPLLHWFNLLQIELVMLKMICCLNWKCDNLFLMLKGTEKKWLQD